MTERQRTDARDSGVAALAIGAAVLAAALAWFVLDGAAHIEDEATYRWQAAQLASLRLGGPPPALQAWVPLTFCPEGAALAAAPTCYGAFPSGWPAVLAIGVALGVPWLVNPLLHGLVTWRAATLARAVAGPTATLPAALLVGLSPQMLLVGASGMSHTWVALLAVVGAELAVAWRAAGTRSAPGAAAVPEGGANTGPSAARHATGAAGAARGPEDRANAGPSALGPPALLTTRTRFALAMGVVAGLCFLARPLCGVLLAGFLAAACPGAWAALLPLGAAVAVQAGLNHIVSGDALAWPIDAWVRTTDLPATCNAMGFGPDRGCIPGRPPGHDLAGALANTGHNLRVWFELLGSPLMGPLALLAAWQGPARWPRRFLAVAVATVAAYALYWFDGTAYGARFYHLAAPLLLVSAALALAWVPRFGLVVVTVDMFTRLVVTLPELDGYWGVDGRAARLARSWDQGPAVVLVDTRALGMLHVDHPRTGPREGAFDMPPRHAWATANGGDVLFADIDQLAAARDLGRPVWVWEMRPDATEDRLLRVTDSPTRGASQGR